MVGDGLAEMVWASSNAATAMRCRNTWILLIWVNAARKERRIEVPREQQGHTDTTHRALPHKARMCGRDVETAPARTSWKWRRRRRGSDHPTSHPQEHPTMPAPKVSPI